MDGPLGTVGLSLMGSKAGFGTGNPDRTVASSTSINGGGWVHVAATREKSTSRIRVFVNGIEEDDRTTGNTGSLTQSSILWIGRGQVIGDPFAGTIDEVRVWNVVRIQAQIQATMNTSLVGNEAGLVGYWRFDEASGSTAFDSSTSANHGSLGGGIGGREPTWVVSDSPVP